MTELQERGPGGAGTLVYDGECGFCTTSARWARKVVPGLVTVPWQLAELDTLGISRSAAAAKVQYVDAAGAVSAGAAGIARMLVSGGGPLGLLGRFMLLPGVRTLASFAYTVVSENRHRLPGGTPACRLVAAEKDG